MEVSKPDEIQEDYEAIMEGEAPEQETAPAAPVQPRHEQKKEEPSGPTTKQKLKRFYHECLRVFKITKKPDRQEFLTVVKISGAGMLVIGAIGFIIHLIERLLMGKIF